MDVIYIILHQTLFQKWLSPKWDTTTLYKYCSI